MDAYKITERQMDELYRVKTVMEVAQLIGESSNPRRNEMTPLVELFGQLAGNMERVLLAAELIPEPHTTH